MRYVSVFSGIEAASVAWGSLGWEPVAFSEIEAFPSAVLAARYPRVPNYGDITKIDWSKHDGCCTADVLVGGSPCQSFSIAGGRTGLNGASGLMWEYVRAVRELRPRWLVWENVPGALSSSHGEDFACLLRALDGLGYGLAWRVLDARARSGGDGRAVALDYHPQDSRIRYADEDVSQTLSARMGTGGNNVPLVQETVLCATDSGAHSAIAENLAPTLTAHEGKSASYVSGYGPIRRLTPVECERLQGFPDGWTDVPYRGKEHAPDSPRYKALGNSMAVPVMAWIGRRIQQAEAGCHEH